MIIFSSQEGEGEERTFDLEEDFPPSSQGKKVSSHKEEKKEATHPLFLWNQKKGRELSPVPFKKERGRPSVMWKKRKGGGGTSARKRKKGEKEILFAPKNPPLLLGEGKGEKHGKEKK